MRIYAHRGASGDFPEGSKQAYLAAIEQGADGFECDVRLTKDKQIICYHDKDTKRLANLDLEIAKKLRSQKVELKYFSSHFHTLPHYVIRKVLIAVDTS